MWFGNETRQNAAAWLMSTADCSILLAECLIYELFEPVNETAWHLSRRAVVYHIKIGNVLIGNSQIGNDKMGLAEWNGTSRPP